MSQVTEVDSSPPSLPHKIRIEPMMMTKRKEGDESKRSSKESVERKKKPRDLGKQN